ncbi:MAG TPA: type II toxin-antitoxin system VapC family toxin, partial [Hymenobacter sp.]
MASLILFDSDVLIDVLRKDALAETLLTTLASAGPLGISVVSRMETIRGCRNFEVQQQAEKLLKRFQVIALDEAISRRADELISQYYLGYNLEIPDALIAATAIEYDLPL